MLLNRKKIDLIVNFLLATLLLLGCLSMKQIVEIAGDNREQLPIRSLTLTIDPSQRDELFDQLRKLADKHNFEFLKSEFGPSGERFIIEMLGNHIKILADDTPKAPTIIAIDFYDQTRGNSVSEETVKKIDRLVSDLRTFLNEIPNVTITEGK